jgi:tetratricopeptide (TPR) repeat protein
LADGVDLAEVFYPANRPRCPPFGSPLPFHNARTARIATAVTTDPLPNIQRPLQLLQERRLDEAVELLERAVEKLPAHLAAHVLLARAYQAQEKWNAALRAWESARFFLPNSPIVQQGKRRTLERMGDAEIEDPARHVSPAATPGPDLAGATKEGKPSEADPQDAPAREEDGPASPSETETSADEKDGADTEEFMLDAPSETAAEEASSGKSSPEGSSAEARPPEAQSAQSQSSQDTSPAARAGDAAGAEGEADDEAQSGFQSSFEPHDTGDLDRLIDELESARIEPDPDPDNIPEPDLDDDIDDLVSETLARIYESQGQLKQAAQIYLKLASQDPDQAQTYMQKAKDMKAKADEQAAQESEQAAQKG